MVDFATTKMSSRGQVVVPESIRDKLGLKSGCRFLVLGEKDAVVLKAISAPDKKEFQDLVAKARKEAKRAGLTPEDVDEAIAKVRRNKRNTN